MGAVDSKRFVIVGDNLSLDFLNTQIIQDGKPKDLLTNFQDFVAWQNAAGLLEASEVERLIQRWGRGAENEKVFTEVLDFRKQLRDIVESVVRGKSVKPSAIQKINSVLRQKYGYHHLVKTSRGFEKHFQADFQEPRQLLLPIAESAADLLSSGNTDHVRKCESSTCILYFYDTTKNHRRRWCSMTSCGNRAKAAAFYERKRKKRKLH